MGSNCRSRNKAFSLLEVIVSISILSIGIVSLLQAFSAALRSTGLSSDIINAVFLAEDKLEELEFKEIQKTINQEPDTASANSGKFTCQTRLDFLSDLNLYVLDMAVKWQRSGKEEKITLNTYLRK